ncbi:MAG: DUF6512 family protein [Bacillota bacterium]
MDNKKIIKWEAVGFLFSITAGFLLHYCFEWSNSFKPIAFLCAVNESVWEHLKLCFWPFIIFSIIEYLSWGKKNGNFLMAKFVGSYIGPVFIITAFYIYTTILGTHNLFLDIGIYAISVIVQYLVSYRLITADRSYSEYNLTVALLLISAMIAFILFTYMPLKLDIFMDHTSNFYGIPKKY